MPRSNKPTPIVDPPAVACFIPIADAQYASTDYRRLIAVPGLEASMSRAGNCYDNAAMESFWRTL